MLSSPLIVLNRYNECVTAKGIFKEKKTFAFRETSQPSVAHMGYRDRRTNEFHSLHVNLLKKNYNNAKLLV